MAFRLQKLNRRWTAARAAGRLYRRQKRANGWRAEAREPIAFDDAGIVKFFWRGR